MQEMHEGQWDTSDTHQPLSYSHSNHRTLIVAYCAASKCLFNSVADPYYVQEVEMLCPGTRLPSPAMVSRDVKAMYSVGAEVVHKDFLVHNLSHCDFNALVLTGNVETQWCRPSCNGWMDVANPSLLPWNCCNLVLQWSGSLLHSRVCQV